MFIIEYVFVCEQREMFICYTRRRRRRRNKT